MQKSNGELSPKGLNQKRKHEGDNFSNGVFKAPKTSSNEAACGFTASQVFNRGYSYTYDDIIFHPGHINFAADDVRLHGHITKKIR